jgi:hypothetical protein
MTDANPTDRGKFMDADPIAVETVERRKRMEQQDWAFIAQLRAAILCGLETPAGVLGQEHGPRRPPRRPPRRINTTTG